MLSRPFHNLDEKTPPLTGRESMPPRSAAAFHGKA
jgi:hypothetical protein